MEPLTFCISTYNNLPYLKLAVQSVRKNSWFKQAPFIIHAENCTDGTDEWLKNNSEVYNFEYYIEKNEPAVGIGGGMNKCASLVKTEYILFLHSDFYVTKNWDKELYDLSKSLIDDTWTTSYRIEPNMFNNTFRPGTTFVDKNTFGAYHNNFDSKKFESWVSMFKEANKNYLIPKGEGVSGLIKKSVWDRIGGNDPIFAPTSYEDMDLFLRMKLDGVKFWLTADSVVWHFGARGSHRLEENNGASSERQRKSEQKNIINWLNKWKYPPRFDEYEMIDSQGFNR